MHMRSRKPRYIIKNLASIGIALLLITILSINLYQNCDALQEQNIVFTPVLFSLSLPPLVLSYLFIPSMWCRILASLGVALSYRKAFCIQYLSHLGRYIPGKIWSYVAQAYLASQEQVAVTETLSSNVMLMCLMNLSSLLVFTLSLLAWNALTLTLRCALVVSTFVLMYWLCRRHLLERGINAVMTRWPTPHAALRCTSLHYTPLIVEMALSWVVFAVGMHLMLLSFYPVEMIHSVVIIGIFAIAWLAGYYAFLSPGGLGVQEGIQVYLLTFFFPLPVSIMIAFASRLWMLLGDLIVFLLAVVLTIYDNRLQRSTHGSYL